MERTIKIDGKDVLLRCTAKTPIIYNRLLRRDMLVDFEKLQNIGETIPAGALENFLNLAFVMAYQAAEYHHNDEGFPQTPDEWLDQFEMFSIYENLSVIMAMIVGDKAQLVAEKNA